ncbi:hypothetical protein Trydic_g8999 [Trypoxylus dichotomus]
MAFIIFVICLVLSAISCAELPSIFKKCSLSGDINECIKNNGNDVISQLVKEGSPLLNAPKAAPLCVSQVVLPGDDFVTVLRNIELEGLENTTITNARFNIADKEQLLNLTSPVLALTADYSILDNNFFFPSVRAGGEFKMFLDDNSINYISDMTQTTRDAEVYLKATNVRVNLITRRIRYNFSRIYADNAADYLGFLNNHKQLVDVKIRPAVEKILWEYMFIITNTLVDKLPLKAIFDE